MEPQSLIVFLQTLPDNRKAKGKRHQQTSILVIMIMALLCGKTALKEIARFAQAHALDLAAHLILPRGKVPSYSSFQRLSQRLPITEVCAMFNAWMAQHIKAEAIAADGKSITSTVQNAQDAGQSFASLVSFFGQKSQLIYQLGFLENDKGSEIQVVQELLGKMQITQAIFSLDALHCQKKTAQDIIDSGNGYVIAVKQNQPTLYQAIAETVRTTKPLDAWSWQQTGHGHDAQCRIKVWEADERMKQQWPGLQRYASVRRQGIRDGKPFDTTTFYIISENLSAWRSAQIIRGHRKIENTLHWTKDVVLQEDDCGLKDKQPAATMAVMRSVSFNLLVMNGYRSISEGISAMAEKVSTLWGMISGEKACVQQ